MHIGFSEIAIVIILAIALIKPDKLIELSKGLGKAVREMKEKEEDVKDVCSPLTELVSETEEIKKEINKTITG